MPGKAGSSRVNRGSRGQALPEFALILAPLMIILLAILQFGFIFSAQIGLINGVREAARFGAASAPTTTTAQATAYGTNVYNALVGTPNGYLQRNVFAYSPSNLVTTPSPTSDTQVCYRLVSSLAGKPAILVKVEAYYRHPLFIPLISAIVDGVDGSSDGALRLGAVEEMRVENAEFVTAPVFPGVCVNP